MEVLKDNISSCIFCHHDILPAIIIKVYINYCVYILSYLYCASDRFLSGYHNIDNTFIVQYFMETKYWYRFNENKY